MRHLNDYRKLGRVSSHRKAMLRNMTTSLVKHERIETTLPKAKELRGMFDRMITLGKRGDLHARRRALAYVKTEPVVTKLFKDLASRFSERRGGYTRLIKTRRRVGDAARMVVIELVAKLAEKKSPTHAGAGDQSDHAGKASKAGSTSQ